MKTTILLAIFLLAFASTAHGDDFTAEEQALLDKGATIQMYRPNEHSRHDIVGITPGQPGRKVGEKVKTFDLVQ